MVAAKKKIDREREGGRARATVTVTVTVGVWMCMDVHGCAWMCVWIEDGMNWKKRSSTLGIPTWSPTVVLTEPDNA